MKSFRAEPLSDKIQKPQSHEKITFQAPKTLVKTFHNAPRSKALESVCLFRPHGQPIPTQSLKGKGEGMVFPTSSRKNLIFYLGISRQWHACKPIGQPLPV